MPVESVLRESQLFSKWLPGSLRVNLPGSKNICAFIIVDGSDRSDLISHISSFNFKIAKADQVHGSSIASIERGELFLGSVPGCDALATNAPGICLCVKSADCLPVFLWDSTKNAVALVHAGWRGLKKGILSKTAAFLNYRFSCNPSDISALIGPSIHRCCYSVGSEFKEFFGNFVYQENGGYFCDLAEIAQSQLRLVGVSSSRIMDSGQCTCCGLDGWPSVRKNPGTQDRLLSLIVIADPKVFP